jgi:hypothetical protein
LDPAHTDEHTGISPQQFLDGDPQERAVINAEIVRLLKKIIPENYI